MPTVTTAVVNLGFFDCWGISIEVSARHGLHLEPRLRLGNPTEIQGIQNALSHLHTLSPTIRHLDLNSL